jgi:hypothetical protein
MLPVCDSSRKDPTLNPALAIVADLGAAQDPFIAFIISAKENGQWITTPQSDELLECDFHGNLVAMFIGKGCQLTGRLG